VLRHGRVKGERTVRPTSPEEIVSLITGELGESAPAGRRQLSAPTIAWPMRILVMICLPRPVGWRRHGAGERR
jgi:hypothetical protein